VVVVVKMWYTRVSFKVVIITGIVITGKGAVRLPYLGFPNGVGGYFAVGVL